MVPVQQIVRATYETPDLGRQASYYTEVMGLHLSHRDDKQVILKNQLGAETLIFTKASAPRCIGKAFQVSSDLPIDTISKALADEGIRADHRTDTSPAIRNAVVFEDVNGTIIEITPEFERSADVVPPQGISLLKLGHIAFNVADPAASADFYCKFLGFRVSDWMEDFFVFLRCNPDHHTVNFRGGFTPAVDHIAFELKDWAHVQSACEVLALHRRPLLWGPMRHSVGHNIAVYHRDPDGNMIELFAEMDQMKSEALGFFDPRQWHRDRPQKPKRWTREEAASYWGVPSAPDYSKGRPPMQPRRT